MTNPVTMSIPGAKCRSLNTISQLKEASSLGNGGFQFRVRGCISHAGKSSYTRNQGSYHRLPSFAWRAQKLVWSGSHWPKIGKLEHQKE